MSGNHSSSSEQTGPAMYKCFCGEQMEFHPDEFRRLHWLKNRFGYTSVSEAIGDIRRCCPTPEYTAISGEPGSEPEAEQ